MTFVERLKERALETGFLDLDVAKGALILRMGVSSDEDGAFAENVGFDLAGAFETPLGFANRTGEHLLYGGLGREFGEELGAITNSPILL